MPKPFRRGLRVCANLAIDLKDRRRSEPRTVVWILSHMRSGSTLLMHLLSSHPEILGAGERNARYASTEDFRKLEVDSFVLRRQLLSDFDYVVDQINHDRLIACEDLLDQPQVKKIFLIREPKASIASMVEVLGRFYGMSKEDAIAYHIGRLRTMQRYAQRGHGKQNQAVLRYEELVRNSESVLPRLASWLGLASELGENYRTFDFTGSRGDPSQRIRSGRIQGDFAPRDVDLEPDELDHLEKVYGEARATLEACCTDLQD